MSSTVRRVVVKFCCIGCIYGVVMLTYFPPLSECATTMGPATSTGGAPTTIEPPPPTTQPEPTTAPDWTGLTACYTDSFWNTTCYSYTGVCYVRYEIASYSVTLGCNPYYMSAITPTLPVSNSGVVDDNETMATVASVTTNECPDAFRGYYANGLCEYCCLGNRCNRDKPLPWVVADCVKLGSSVGCVAKATAAVTVATVALSWLRLQ